MSKLSNLRQCILKNTIWFAAYLYTILSFTSCVSLDKNATPKREFRAIWVATVVNIDWPSQSTLSIEDQQKEFIKILEDYDGLNFNAVIVQVRAAGDAFYDSSYEPWSKYLTGQQGLAPAPYYDPLEWMIKETHKRGLEFHAWFNPYRATFDLDTTQLSEKHIYYQHPEWLVKYGKKYYFNPGLPEVIDFTTNVILEVVNNYKVDAIHFDDYFYPYKEAGIDFEDSAAFAMHPKNINDIDDWRRDNVNQLVKTINDSIKSVKPWVQFGISPFGVWRNKSVDSLGSDTRAGQTTFDDLYADPLLWMKEQWIDYLIPQIYWALDFPIASHRTLVDWWAKQTYDGNLYIGHGLYKVKNNADKRWDKYDEIPNQISNARKYSAIDGAAYFSAKSLQGNHKRLEKKFRKEVYPYPALTPTVPFVNNANDVTPVSSKAVIQNESINISLEASAKAQQSVIVYAFFGDDAQDLTDPTNILHKEYTGANGGLHLKIDAGTFKKLTALSITYLNKYGVESSPLNFNVDLASKTINYTALKTEHYARHVSKTARFTRYISSRKKTSPDRKHYY